MIIIYSSIRYFKNKKFVLAGTFRYKKYASQTARHIRNEGLKARIIHDKTQTKKYAVYRG